jgi:hypothetical protein
MLLTTLMKEGTDLIGPCIADLGTLDGMVRFLETESVELIEEILIGMCALSNRCLWQQEESDLFTVFRNSGAFVEYLQGFIASADDGHARAFEAATIFLANLAGTSGR